MSSYTAEKVIAAVTHMDRSGRENGNPRYNVVFADGSGASTGVDAAVAYGISNSEYQNTPVLVTFNEHNHIIGVSTADGQYSCGALPVTDGKGR